MIWRLRYFWLHLKNWVRNLIAYTPVLWGNYDFDVDYLLRLIQFKLVRMESSMRNSPIVRADEAADQMLDAIMCLEVALTALDEPLRTKYDTTEDYIKAETEAYNIYMDYTKAALSIIRDHFNEWRW